MNNTPPNMKEQQDRIRHLLRENNVKLYSHTYQRPEIQEIADVLGDSLRLAMRVAEERETEFILFAAVTFMAETASIVNQNKKILVPTRESPCPMANMAPGSLVREFKAKYPGLPVVLYVNTVAEAKAEADIVCTSSNAIPIVQEIAREFGVQRVLFGPDKNLGRWVQEKTGIETIIIPPHGHCYVHQQFTGEEVHLLKEIYPNGYVMAHPECPKDVVDLADYVGSTGQMFSHAKNDTTHNIFLVATEIGEIAHMKREMPSKHFVPVMDIAVCRNMKNVTLANLLNVLEHLDHWQKFAVQVPPDIAVKAKKAIDRMIAISKQLGFQA
ncbi:MAG: Quinolinate synthase A [Promethearchaeota archaeon CR_4]|nr:MAG: Quinolinate synthase A [Candidatus Lokiarchaeota archaeon CR_4]